jgi:AcrR family transcriptional regulator
MTVPQRLRGRPRDPDVDEQIMEAARKLLAQNGYDALTFEMISQLTGIGRPTIYRRWPTKTHLLNDIANGGDVPLPDVIEAQGLRAEIHALISQVADRYNQPELAAASIGMIVAFQRNPELRNELHLPLEERARRELSAIVEKGQRSGLLHAGTDADTLFDTIVGTLIFRLMFSSKAPPASYVDRLTEQIIRGIEQR